MKILTTAAFSVILLRKKLSSTQWLALFCLALGVGVVQIQGSSHDSARESISAGVRAMNSLKGFFAVVSACFTSGLAGVYFEMVLKNSQADLWVRNVQLSLFSLLPALAPVFLTQRASISFVGNGFFSTLFDNFGAWAWATVIVQVVGGLVTAMVIKYSDNIMKGFATSLSIVISFLASVALFDFQMTITFVLGSSIVLIATWLYNQPGRATSRVSLVTLTPLTSEKLLKEKDYYYSPPLLHSLTTVSSTTSISSMAFSAPPSASDSEKTFFR
jgi:UDP-sugar transporter A1/2/3